MVTVQRSSVTAKSEGTSSQKPDGSSTHLRSIHSVLVLIVGDKIEKLAGPALPQGLTYTLRACTNGEWEEISLSVSCSTSPGHVAETINSQTKKQSRRPSYPAKSSHQDLSA